MKTKGHAFKLITLTVAECKSHTKSEFYEAVRKSCNAARSIVNRSTSMCIAQDDLLKDKIEKLYTYPHCKDMLPPKRAAVTANLCRAAEARYLQERAIVRAGKGTPRISRTFHWPLLKNKSISMYSISESNGVWSMKLRLIDSDHEIRIASGSDRKRIIAGIKRAIEVGRICDSKIYIAKDGSIKIGVWCELPVQQATENGRSLDISTSPEALLVMQLDSDGAKATLTECEIARWSMERKKRHREIATNLTLSNRTRKELHNAASRKYDDRIKTKIHDVASRVAKFATTNKVSCACVDICDRGYCGSFRWWMLREEIVRRFEHLGIKCYACKIKPSVSANMLLPHIYFLHDEISGRCKIGCTARAANRRLSELRTANPGLQLLAIVNCTASDLKRTEKHFHSILQNSMVGEKNKRGQEVFYSKQVLIELARIGVIGNCGNIEELIKLQSVNEAYKIQCKMGHPQAESDKPASERMLAQSSNAASGADVAKATARTAGEYRQGTTEHPPLTAEVSICGQV